MTGVFRKLLVANRGEIACRIMRTARRMGIRTAAIWSDADRDCAHVALADEAYRVGPPPAAQSYLDIARIVEICREADVDAVHPGYGFLSERPAFAEALVAAGVHFVGPNAKAIHAMGDKITAKRVAAEAGVSVVPGYLGGIETVADAGRIAEEIGYPVMIKATAGGGGKGMRIAHSAADMAEGVERSRSEAAASFGDDRIFLEKFIVEPRHIEIQILADRHGNVIHLGERECSVQRRHQKVLEEAPSPMVDPAMRQSMGAQAISLAQAVGYDSAGTVEFVVGQDKSFYFLEMNTRLQVEHPVTEMVTGLDLVEEMIRSAAGDRLRYRQEDIRLNGWAIESRICAEQPERGFLPSGGRLSLYRPPAAEPGCVRIDDGVRDEDDVPPLYDPLVAKLITHADTRAGAIERQIRALDTYVVEGIATNIDFLSDLHRNRRWREGRLSTAFLAEEYGGTYRPCASDDDELRQRGAVACAIHLRRFWPEPRRGSAGPEIMLSLIHAMGRRDFRVRRTEDSVTIAGDGGEWSVKSFWHPGEPLWRGTVGGCAAIFKVRIEDDAVILTQAGRVSRIRVMSPRQADLSPRLDGPAADAAGGVLSSPLLGLLVRWMVAEGDRFAAGDGLCVVEAMKMEMVLRAERDGTVTQLAAAAGDRIEAGHVLMRFD